MLTVVLFQSVFTFISSTESWQALLLKFIHDLLIAHLFNLVLFFVICTLFKQLCTFYGKCN